MNILNLVQINVVRTRSNLCTWQRRKQLAFLLLGYFIYVQIYLYCIIIAIIHNFILHKYMIVLITQMMNLDHLFHSLCCRGHVKSLSLVNSTSFLLSMWHILWAPISCTWIIFDLLNCVQWTGGNHWANVRLYGT